MFYHHIAAAAGVLLGGKISDMMALRRRTVRIEVEMLGLFLGAPFIFFMGSTGNFWTCCLCLAGFGLFRGVYDSNLYAALFDVIEPRYRSSAVGLMLAVVFFFSAFAPVVLGWAKMTIGLSSALSALSVAYVIGGLILLYARNCTFLRDFYHENTAPASAEGA